MAAARTKASTPLAGRPHLDSIGLAVSSAEAGGDPLGEPFPSLPQRTGGSEPLRQGGARTEKKEKQEEMDWKGTRRSVLKARGGQPSISMIAGNHDPFCMQGLVQSVQLPRRHGEVDTPTSNKPPCGAQGRRLLGPAELCSCPSASLHDQVRVRLGPGGYCRRSGNGGPQTCLPEACSVAQKGARRGPSS